MVDKKEKLIDALNRIDGFASYGVEDNDNGEAEQLQDDYNLLSDFITGKHKIKIDFSQEDLEDLQRGETFDWTYPTNTGIDIDVHLFNNNI